MSAILGINWRFRIAYENNEPTPTPDELAHVRCPFAITPEVTPSSVPSKFTKNLRHYTADATPESVPWSGYYANYLGARLAVANAFGVWFEIQRRPNGWEAIRPAPASLGLKNCAATGIDEAALWTSGEETVPAWDNTQVHGRGPTRDSNTAEGEEEGSTHLTELRSSQTERGRGPRRRRCSWGGPFTHEDLNDDDPRQTIVDLEGNPPEKFEGDRSNTRAFLVKFNLFMRINRISRYSLKRCGYFLSLIDGPKVEGWVDRQYDWLDKVEADPTILRGMTAWQALEDEFRNAFFDHAGRERAQEDIRKLKMKEDDLDGYVDKFQYLAYRGGLDVNEPESIRLFARGLLPQVAEGCIDLDGPETYGEWVKAAQKQQLIWLKKQSFRNTSGPSQEDNESNAQRQGNPSRGQFYWRRRNQGGQGQQARNPTHRTMYDANAMDRGATVRKVVTDAEKYKYG